MMNKGVKKVVGTFSVPSCFKRSLFATCTVSQQRIVQKLTHKGGRVNFYGLQGHPYECFPGVVYIIIYIYMYDVYMCMFVSHAHCIQLKKLHH